MTVPRLPGVQPPGNLHKPDLPRAVPWARVKSQPSGKIVKCPMKDGTEDVVLVLQQARDLTPGLWRVELEWRQNGATVSGWFVVGAQERRRFSVPETDEA